MGKINVVGNAVVLKSCIKLEDIKKAEKYRPDALVLRDDGGKEIFKVSAGRYPSANEYGITFTGRTHEDGFATCTWVTDEEIGDDAKEFLADIYGAALIKLGEFERVFPSSIAEIDAERTNVLAQISLD